MTKPQSLMSDQSLDEGAFMLLSCSSLSRYVRMAKSLAESSGLRDQIWTGVLSVQDALSRSRFLWSRVMRSAQRSLSEIELAAILAAIAETSSDEVSDILVQLSLQDQHSTAWISALARHLHQERPRNELCILPETSLGEEVTWWDSGRSSAGNQLLVAA